MGGEKKNAFKNKRVRKRQGILVPDLFTSDLEIGIRTYS